MISTVKKIAAIKAYEENIIANKKTNPKRFYKYVSRKEKYKNNTISLKQNDKIESSPSKCANILNCFFGSVFTDGASETSNIPENGIIPGTMPDVEISESKVRTKIMKLNIQKTVGPDGICALLLQKAVDIFVPILTKLFNMSYETGYVPKMMKNANIVPIFKSGDKRSPNNYRPVSITSIIAKVFESIIKDDLQKHIDKYDIIVNNQHGFCSSKSTATNLLEFWNNVTDAPENKTSLSIIYTDIKKAF